MFVLKFIKGTILKPTLYKITNKYEKYEFMWIPCELLIFQQYNNAFFHMK